MKQVRALARHDVSARLGELAGIPTLIVSGADDPIAKPEYGRQLARAIPHATCEEMAGASHGLTIQCAGTVNDRLRRFFKQVS